MSITIPAFSQFQGVLIPLRGLWNSQPQEGDRFVNAEIDWGSLGGTPPNTTVQFSLSGNSPVAFSQIVAMSVDNSRCGSDVDFIFPDSGFVLTVPGYNQGTYPVFTNALMFYASAPLAVSGDVTIVQILNSMPPPVAIQPSSEQAQAGAGNVNLALNATSPVIANTVSGTIEGFSLAYTAIGGAGTTNALVTLIDGTGRVIWSGTIALPASGTQTNSVNVSPIRVRFVNGVNVQISSSTIPTGNVAVNLYYSVP